LDKLALTTCIFEEEEEEDDEVSVSLLGQEEEPTTSSITQEVVNMDNSESDSHPKKLYDDDNVEIPETAHQISKGNIIFCILSCFVFYILFVTFSLFSAFYW
jgi:hypothetical protein